MGTLGWFAPFRLGIDGQGLALRRVVLLLVLRALGGGSVAGELTEVISHIHEWFIQIAHHNPFYRSGYRHRDRRHWKNDGASFGLGHHGSLS